MKRKEMKKLFDELYDEYLKQNKLLPTKSTLEKASKDLNFNFLSLIDDSFSNKYNKNEIYVLKKAEEMINKLLNIDVYDARKVNNVVTDKLYLPTCYYDKMIIWGFVCHYHITTKKGDISFERKITFDEIVNVLRECMIQYIEDAYDETEIVEIERGDIRINLSEDTLPMVVIENAIMDIINKHQTEIIRELMNDDSEPNDFIKYMGGRGCC